MEGAGCFDEALKAKSIKIVQSKEAKEFKRCYKVWHVVKDMPAMMMADLQKGFPPGLIGNELAGQKKYSI